ncbi:MAG: ATP-binding protein [Candidatus Erginobacter occultus]|nr:ATP-binding protein [Candidatus Erginobacter occultus]
MEPTPAETPLLFPPAAPKKERRVFGLGARLTILVLSGLLCISVITTYISIRQLRDALSAGAREMARTMGQIVGISSAYQGFFDIDNRLLEQYVNFAAEQPNILYAVITGPRGEIIQTGLTSGQVARLLEGEPPYPEEQVHQEEHDIVLDSPVGKIGRIYLGISRREIAAIESGLIRLQLYLTGAITAVFLLLLWGIIHSVTRPLARLTEKTREMGEGILDRPLAITGRDEVGRLAESIEIMRDNLYRKIQTIALLGRVAHDFNAVLDLEEVIEATRNELQAFPLWPWYELGVTLIGRGGKLYPKDQFVYYHVVPETGPEGSRYSIFSLPGTLVAEAVARKEPISRDIPAGLTASRDGFSLYLQDRDISSSVTIPLLVKGKALGMLYAGFRDRSGRTPEIQVICQNLADELARAIEGIYLLYDLRQSLSALKDAHQQLKGLDNLKSEFISSVSHELRTPLVSMTGYLHMMLDEKLGEITDLQREGLEVSVKSLERLTNLIEKMLFFSSQQKERELDLSEFAISDLLEHCARMMRTVAEAEQIEIKTSTEEPLPLARADEDKIIQVLINLVDNAIKFSPEGGVIELRAQKSPDSKMIEVMVIDQGKGIPAGEQEKIFEKFWQGERNEGDRRKGLGLGLALVKKILDQHGGTVSVSSRPGEGTTITFTIPIAPGGDRQ